MSTQTAQTIGKELAAELHTDYNAGRFEAANFKTEFDQRLEARTDKPKEAVFLYWRIEVYDACLTELRDLQERARAA